MGCEACGGQGARPKLRVQGVQILECPSCGLAFWRPGPDFRPERLYDAAYFRGSDVSRGYDDYAALEGSLRATFARRFARLAPPREGARLLDVGAAFGFGVSEAVRAGWRAMGTELSRAAASESGRAVPGRVVVGDACGSPFATASFDAVTLWDVLEHLPRPREALAECARVLRPGGRLVLSTGDVGSALARLCGARWHLYTLPEHLFFYSRRSLEPLLARSGFELESVRAEAAVFTVGYLLERLRKVFLRRGARRPWTGPGLGLRVPVNLFDVVTASARRRIEP